MSKCIWIVLCAAAVACTPTLAGVCSSTADCKIGESCSADGICLRGSNGTGNGDGGTAAAIDIVIPQSGAIEKSTFHVSAQTSSAVAVDSVNFVLSNASNGNPLGSLLVSTSSANTWSGDLTINAASFGGAANLVAVLQRAGHPDVTSSSITLTVDQNAPSISPSWNGSQWWPLDAGLSLTAAVADDRSGVASAALILPDGGTTAGTIAAGVATFQLPASAVGSAGAASIVPVSLAASDLAGNQTLNAAAANLQIDDQPPSISLQALDATVWRNGPLDVNANVNDGTGSGLASTSLLLGGKFTPGAPDGGGGFNYHANLSALAPTEAAVAVQVLATDAVGNQADAGFSINVDNVPPAVSGARFDTAFDGIDSASQGWFSGPTAAPSAGPIVVSAAITDTNLVATGANAPVAIVGAARYAGTFTSDRWNFPIPRSAGLNASASMTVSFDAQDLAGNHPVTPPSLTLRFDDVPASSFKPTIAPDTAWHARAGSLAIGVNFGTAPRSGFASVLLKVNSQADVTCTSSSSVSWSCALPTADATAGTEGPLNFTVAAMSVTKLATSSAGFRNIDDVAPVISSTSTATYPTGTWGHDGSHFTLRDSGTFYSFKVYDCGSGLNTNPVAVSASPQLSTRGATITNSGGTHSCPSGGSATVYDVAISGDLSTSAPGSFAGADNTFSVSATVQDMAGNQTSSASPAINATRRLWQTASIAAFSLAMGPVLIAAASNGTINGVNPADGSTAWTISNTAGLFSGPSVGGTASVPLVYYGLNALSSGPAFFSASASNGAASLSCNTLCKPAAGAGCTPNAGYQRNGQFLSVATDGTAVVLEDDTIVGTVSTGGDCGGGGYGAWHIGASCPPGANLVPTTTAQNSKTAIPGQSADGLALGRSGKVFYSSLGLPYEVLISAAGVTSGSVTCGGLYSVSDNGGSDSPLCGGQKVNFNGAFSSGWSATMPSPLDAAGVVLSRNGSTLALGNGAGLIGTSATVWAVDGSPTPVVYLASGVTLSTQKLTSGGLNGGAAWGLPAVPGTAVTDMVMDKSGILYVASNGQVSAIITDSPGLGTANNAWPIAGHDACRSSNLEFSCPW